MRVSRSLAFFGYFCVLQEVFRARKFREIIFEPEGYEADIKASRGQNSLIEKNSVFVYTKRCFF